jgi:ABC-type glycerol-3-phosphate transport system substrate-binding protein
VGTALTGEEAAALKSFIEASGLVPKGTRLVFETMLAPDGSALAGRQGKADTYDLVMLPPSMAAALGATHLAPAAGTRAQSELAALLSPALAPSLERGVLPLLVSPCGLYYNRRVLEAAGLEPPTTFEDLRRAALALKARGLVALAVGGAEKGRLYDLYVQTGSSLDLWYGLFRDGLVEPAPASWHDTDAARLLLEGRAGFLFAPMTVHGFIAVEDEPKIGYAPFPALPGKTSLSLVGRLIGAGLTRRGALKPAARTLIGGLARPAAQEALVLAEAPRFTSLPALKDAPFANEEGRRAALALAASSSFSEGGSGYRDPGKGAALDAALGALARAPSASPDAALVADLQKALAP